MQIYQAFLNGLNKTWEFLAQELGVLLLVLLWAMLRVSLLAVRAKEKELRIKLGRLGHISLSKKDPTQLEKPKTEVPVE